MGRIGPQNDIALFIVLLSSCCEPNVGFMLRIPQEFGASGRSIAAAKCRIGVRSIGLISPQALAKKSKQERKDEKDATLEIAAPARVLVSEKEQEVIPRTSTVAEEAEQREASGKRRSRRRSSSGVGSELRFKLLEEQAQPFRRFRQFLYIAAAGSAGIGSLVSGSRIFAALSGVQGVQPLSETLPNTAINLAVVAISAGLWYWDDQRGKGLLDKIAERSSVRQQLAELKVELYNGEMNELRSLRDRYRLVILAGTAAEVTRCINVASRQGDDLYRYDVLVVPFFTDLADDSEGWKAMRDNGPTGRWDPWLARPVGRDAFAAWLAAERAQAAADRGKETVGLDKSAEAAADRLLRVFVVRKDGKIGARTVGPPAWSRLVAQIKALPVADDYGTP